MRKWDEDGIADPAAVDFGEFVFKVGGMLPGVVWIWLKWISLLGFVWMVPLVELAICVLATMRMCDLAHTDWSVCLVCRLNNHKLSTRL